MVTFIITKNSVQIDTKKVLERNDDAINELKNESQNFLDKEIDSFVNKIIKLVNKQDNKSYKSGLQTQIKNLGYLTNILEETKIEQETSISTKASDIVENLNNRYRMRTNNIKNYINNFFRKYISMVSNYFDPTDYIQKIKGLDDIQSKEVQKYIYENENFIKKYITKSNAELFKNLEFNYTADEIDNLVGDANIYDADYVKQIKTMNFDLCHLSEALLYILVKNLDKFISTDYLKGKENLEANRTIALFILDILKNINTEKEIFNIPPSRKFNLEGKWSHDKKSQNKNTGVGGVKDTAHKMIADFQYKIGKSAEESNYDQLYTKMEETDMQDKLKEDFVEKYKTQFDKAPTESEILDFLDEKVHDDSVDDTVNKEEYSLAQLKQGDDVLDVGDGYGEMEQGIEDEDDSGYQGFEEDIED